jgi:hypothetical protein
LPWAPQIEKNVETDLLFEVVSDRKKADRKTQSGGQQTDDHRPGDRPPDQPSRGLRNAAGA